MTRARDRWLLGAFVLSGAAALGYEILWTRLLALALGSETLGVLGVLAGFFGGMAAGAAALHDRVRRSADPVRLFARLELVAAGFAALSPLWLHALASWLPRALGPTAGDNSSNAALAVAIAVSAVVLLPGTFCLGATLPALVEARRRACPDEPDGRGLGRLYAANTLGAAAGVLLTVHVLLPAGGMVPGALVLAGLGVGAAGLGTRWWRSVGRPAAVPDEASAREARAAAETTTSSDDQAPAIDTSKDPDPDVAREPWLLLALLAGTGLTGVGLEVVVVQILSQVLENTIFTLHNVLAVYLLGTALGAAIYTRYAAKAIAGRPATVTAGLVLAHGAATVWAAGMLAGSPDLLEGLAGAEASAGAHMLAEGLVTAVVLGPATLLMGALFSHVAGLLAPRGVGRAYALNTLGGAAAPFVFGLGAIGSLGYRDALFSVAYAYLGLFGLFTWFRRFKPIPQIAGILGVVALTAVTQDDLLLATRGHRWDHDRTEGWVTIDSRQTVLGAVVVSERRPGGKAGPSPLRRLQVGQEFRMGGATGFGERRMGEIPLLLHPAPRRALFLGVGTGATLGAVVGHQQLEHVDAVELVPAVLELLFHFASINGEVERDERVTLHAADARRFVAASPERYDVIVADLYHPGRDGAGNLYAREHFENIAARLADDGLFAQWVALYQLDPSTLRVIMRTFAEVFGEVHAIVGLYNVRTPSLVLVGRVPERSRGPLRVDLDAVGARLRGPAIVDARDLLGGYLLDRDALLALAGEAELHTDLDPRVTLQAPRAAYERDNARGRDNLMALLEARASVPEEMIVAAQPEAQRQQHEAVLRFAEAAGHHLRGESVRLDHPDPVEGMAAALEHYLAAYEVEPQFPPARGALLREAVPLHNDLAERVFAAVLERSPDERRVWQDYLRYLNTLDDPERLEEAMARFQRRFGPRPSAPRP